MTGPGQVLRLSLGQGLLSHHARRFNRYLLTLAFLGVGVASGVAALLLGRAWPLTAWAALAAGGFLALALKRGSLRGAAYIVSDWVVVGLGLLRGFVSTPRRVQDFAPPVEWLQ